MFAETQDQEVFESATQRFLEARYPIARVRDLANEPTTFDPATWREAAELGWTALLVSEDAGGGSISGNGLADLIIVAAEFGRHAAPGPVLGANVVAAALDRWGTSEQAKGALAALLAGEAVAAWGHASTAAPVPAEASGHRIVLRGRVPNVESAGDATHVLLTADDPAGPTQYLVPLSAAGVELTALRTIDLTRRFHDVTLNGVEVSAADRVGDPGSAAGHDAYLLDLVATMLAAEITGAMERAFAMTLDWTANRYSFGRPLASYQEIKHRMADMRMQLEASEAVAGRAAFAVGTGQADGQEWASAAMTYVGRYGPEVIQDCIQLHGGIGVTYDHDLHLFLRRATLDANLFGQPSDFAHRLGSLVAATAGAAS